MFTEIPLSLSVVGDLKTKEPKLVLYQRYLQELIVRFRNFMPRSKNQFADALATLASMVKVPEGRLIIIR